MRSRIHALVLFAALAFLFASQATHAHSRSASFDVACAACAAHAQTRATSPAAAPAPVESAGVALELDERAPVFRDSHACLSAAPRGPPVDA
jgi:hypothetical protein